MGRCGRLEGCEVEEKEVRVGKGALRIGWWVSDRLKRLDNRFECSCKVKKGCVGEGVAGRREGIGEWKNVWE